MMKLVLCNNVPTWANSTKGDKGVPGFRCTKCGSISHGLATDVAHPVTHKAAPITSGA